MSEQNIKPLDILIIGAGPTGLFAGFYAGLRQVKALIIDSMSEPGGRLSAIYPEKHIYDVAGFHKILAKDLVKNLVKQTSMFHVPIQLNCTCQNLIFKDDHWHVQTDKSVYKSKSIIITTGMGIFTPKKHPSPSVNKFLDKGVSYLVTKKDFYKDKDLVILGGGDSALDWANELVDVAKSTTLIHRTDRFRAHSSSLSKLKQSSAKILTNCEVKDFQGQEYLESLHIHDKDKGTDFDIKCDEVLVLFGYQSSFTKYADWGLETSKKGIKVNAKMESNLKGVFAAGDIADFESKITLIATGFSEAAIAVSYAVHAINPKEKAQPGYSTNIVKN